MTLFSNLFLASIVILQKILLCNHEHMWEHNRRKRIFHIQDFKSLLFILHFTFSPWRELSLLGGKFPPHFFFLRRVFVLIWQCNNCLFIRITCLFGSLLKKSPSTVVTLIGWNIPLGPQKHFSFSCKVTLLTTEQKQQKVDTSLIVFSFLFLQLCDIQESFPGW